MSKKHRLPQERRVGVPHHESLSEKEVIPPAETEAPFVKDDQGDSDIMNASISEAIEADAKKPVAVSSRATADCESAKEDSCSCRCRGRYHGKPHPKNWKDEAGCEPLTVEERKLAKKNALYAWRRAHPERVSAYMKQWRDEKKKQEADEEIKNESQEGD